MDGNQFPMADSQSQDETSLEDPALGEKSMEDTEPDKKSIEEPEPGENTSQDPESEVKRTDKEQEVTLEDHEDPQKWPHLKKSYYTLGVGLASFSVTVAASMITPGTPEIETKFHVGETPAILTLIVYVLGLALGPVIASPISESLGRAAIYRITPPIYMLLTMGVGFVDSFGGLLVLRFLAGTAGSPPIAMGAGTIADMYAPSRRAAPLCLLISTPFLGSGLGPVIGGFAAYYKGYRWTQWSTIFVAIAVYIYTFPMGETYRNALIKRKAERLGIDTHEPPMKDMLVQLFHVTLVRPFKVPFLEPIVQVLTFYNAFTFSVLFTFFAAFPYVFGKVYGFNTWQSGLAFLGIGVGVVLAGITGVLVDQYMYQPRLRQAIAEGKPGLPPEYMLFSAMLGAPAVPASLFWFGWTARSSINWMSPIIAGGLFSWGSVTIFLSAAMYLIQSYGASYGASAMAANGIGRYLMSGAFPLFTIQMYETLGIGWATSLMAFVAVLLVPIPFVFFKFGPYFRRKSSMIQ
ncbi:hypothetical protein PRZ48_008453 [Zasmidium cellare]|uniref:Major facilitator superfamily (MFS) profile domain-containing protein n=1 Tax=Zasmidium cellare TaxID=395010 RepID=A0ABR0EFW1_ZASCE|nr:hypothetical protein PRZ48_008453 [Zasmidium cellare]